MGVFSSGEQQGSFQCGALRHSSRHGNPPSTRDRKKYTIFSDSMAAIERLRKDRPGPGQAIAQAIIDFEEVMRERRCSPTIRWTSAHKGVEGN